MPTKIAGTPSSLRRSVAAGDVGEDHGRRLAEARWSACLQAHPREDRPASLRHEFDAEDTAPGNCLLRSVERPGFMARRTAEEPAG